jgi:hypothetical protein
MLADMVFELTGAVPGFDAAFARTKIREAWHEIRKLRGWSFQNAQGGFSSTPSIAGGTVSLTYGGTTVTADGTAAVLWANGSQFGSLLSQRQFRIGGGSIYDIVAYNQGAGTITLNRPYTDPLPTPTGNSYLLYQPYYTTPVKDFIRWLGVFDMTNVRWIDILGNYEQRTNVNINDPQRQIYANPLSLLPIGTDMRPGTATPGWLREELYPQPTSQYGYMTWYEWSGPDLVNLSDTLPFPITENLVKTKARIGAYEWAESNKNPGNPRGSGANFSFLMEAANAEYKDLLQGIRVEDRERIDMFNRTMSRIGSPMPFSTYNNSTGVLSVSNLA